ncbi:type I-E CRISPR-associated protein Cas5/CasD [Zymomonas mobilis]|uniref:CRISPR-associated protein Cas5 family n=1 Tax=Zymomonas mobilis subsp. pomaceae (strain ATCC 29192 / DSM 22645 / JCM 10191 / CCUG 17912 / NBRC 13757 / NCIMB 11200 / NRRL B-4491 / Barker I) TaxID=579138 RepID=F8ET04_ZYMMT|nr:type I-E CRISPR-associated protein Cas5/CasD [Zymomonas mobilis]AEI37908.1 CRISPR-associated protein Cas5 family [Zymomonas mobilis subsp. pomaceae ATCC 29192]MDX5949276.1 type I-E CRISPR-associated protein Cas5/CasD [Zymomonas mobilis subsp. pomaceae]GEB89717.1 type I-E CRISPR-associated protein Cas5/CasD [Zymomonas mobilis subsp. pomaceae]
MSDREFLLFRLKGPMAAFGEIAVGERRSLWDVPSKSAILGLVAAAKGLGRQDPKLLALDENLGFAVHRDVAPQKLRDFHTAQIPSEADRKKRQKAGQDISTRRGDLNTKDKLNTVISERFYQTDVAFTVALWAKSEKLVDLSLLGKFLKYPNFVLYLGRKSCPLSAPPYPKIMTASGLRKAFHFYNDDCPLKKKRDRYECERKQEPIWFETGAGLAEEEKQTSLIRVRRDALRNRALWQFSDRPEGQLPWEEPQNFAMSSVIGIEGLQ